MNSEQSLLFKFRGLSGGNSISRIGEILLDRKLFFPNKEQLNDPFEGMTTTVYAAGWAGSSLIRAADEEASFLTEAKDRYKILSLSATCFSPLMWAHYGDECRGLCLCFRADDSFSAARPVIYLQEDMGDSCSAVRMDNPEIDLSPMFFRKHLDWQYEKEWRIVERTDKRYFSFNDTDLVAVIFGNKIDPMNKRIIKGMLSDKVKQYSIHIGHQTGKVHLLPDDYRITYDGTGPKFIDTVEGLFDQAVKGIE